MADLDSGKLNGYMGDMPFMLLICVILLLHDGVPPLVIAMVAAFFGIPMLIGIGFLYLCPDKLRPWLGIPKWR